MTYDAIILTHLSVAPMTKTIGPYRIADTLRKIGWTVQVISMTNTFSQDELLETLFHFTDNKTKLIGVSTTFFQNVDVTNMHNTFEEGMPGSVRNVLKEVKEAFPNVRVIAGGSHSHKQIGDSLFDAVFHGYADNAVLEYALSLTGVKKPIWKYQSGTKIIEGEHYPVEMQHLTHRWEDNDIILPGETLPIEISRGCIFKCKFCNFQLTGKKKLDYIRDAAILKEEFLSNYERFGVTNYTFSDDTFNDSTYKLEKIYEAVRDLPFKINFVTYLRLDLLHANREQIGLLKEIGIRSGFFGIESLNLESAKIVGKGFKSEKIKDFILELKNDHFKNGYSMVYSFIVGLPLETLDSCEKTFQWCNDHDINTIWSPLFIRTEHRYKSDIDINYEKYGYQLEPGTTNKWINEHMTQRLAFEAATRFNQERNNTLHSWPLFDGAALQVGTWEEMTKMRMNGLIHDPVIHAKMAEKISAYKAELKKW